MEIEKQIELFGSEENYSLYLKQSEIAKLNSWFIEYDKQVIQYTRAVALEEEYDKDIMKLHEIAKEKSKRLKELQIEISIEKYDLF